MHPSIPFAVAMLAVPLFRAWLRSVTFIEWTTLEASLGPKLREAGLEELELSGADGIARLAVKKEVGGVWLPLEVLIEPVGLEFNQHIRLGLTLREATLHRPAGLKGWFIHGAARLWLWWKRRTLAELILDLVDEHVDGERAGDTYWFQLDEAPPFAKLLEIRKRIPMAGAIPLRQLATCHGIHPRKKGVQLDVGPGPLLKAAMP